jgi:hypothetical protein
MFDRFYFFSIAFIMLALQSNNLNAVTFALELEPVKLQASSDGAVTAAYLEPCGTEFAGFLYQSQEGGELQVAVVLRRYHARCMGLMGMQQIPLPMVQASSYAAVTSMNVGSAPLMIKPVPVQNLHFTQNLSQTQVHAVYTSQCGQALGLFVQPEATGMRFNVLESTATKPDACNRSTQILSIAGLEPSKLGSFNLIQNPVNDQTPAYTLRRVPVQLMTMDAAELGTKRLQVFYLRRCNEAPVGLIQQNQGKSLHVAMLVAHYETMPCQEEGPKKIWTAYEEPLTLQAQQKTVALRQSPIEDIALARPTSFRWNQLETHSSQLEVFTLSTCNRDLGLVSHPSASGLAIGILQVQSSEPCNSTLKKVSYAYDMELSPGGSRDVKPLQLLGS